MNPVHVIVQRKLAGCDVPTEEQHLYPKTAVVGFHIGPTWWAECIWPSLHAAREYARLDGASFESQLKSLEN